MLCSHVHILTGESCYVTLTKIRVILKFMDLSFSSFNGILAQDFISKSIENSTDDYGKILRFDGILRFPELVFRWFKFTLKPPI